MFTFAHVWLFLLLPLPLVFRRLTRPYREERPAVLAYADCLALQGGRTPEPVFAALKAFLSDEEILELTYITCLYFMHAVMSRALRTEFDDRDDPVVEVAAPEGFDALDFLGGERR